MKFQQDSFFYHHQSNQPIINQQSLPHNLLSNLYSHWNFCALPHCLQHHDFNHSPFSFLSATAHYKFLPKLTSSSSYPRMYFSHHKWHPSCLWSWYFCLSSLQWDKYGADILHFGLLLWNILFGFLITLLTISLVSHQWNYSPRPRSIIVAFSTLMFGDAPVMSLIQSYKIDKNS